MQRFKTPPNIPSSERASTQELATALSELPLDPTKLSDEELAELTDKTRDAELWAKELPDSDARAKYYGNLGLRLARGITREEIKKMTVRDRMNAARQCFDMRQLELDKPTTTVNFQGRQKIMDVLPALTEELDRRKRERMTINVTPGENHDESGTGADQEVGEAGATPGSGSKSVAIDKG